MGIGENLTHTWKPTLTDRRAWDPEPTRAFHAKLDLSSVPEPLRDWATRYGLTGPWMACGPTEDETISAFRQELVQRCYTALDKATADVRRAQREYDTMMEAIARELSH